MKKIILLFISIVVLFGAETPTPADIAAIFEKNQDGQFIYKAHTAIALNGELAAVIYDKNNELNGKDYIKFDPYLGLYLVRINEPLRASAMIDELDSKPDMWVMVLAENNTQIGHIQRFSADIAELDRLDFKSEFKGMLLCDCAAMVGIAVGEDKFVPNRYLRHFMKYEDLYYGDIGVTFEQKIDRIIVKSVNPFGTGAQLEIGDEITAVNGRRPQDLRDMNETILFAPKNSILKIAIKRGNEERAFEIKMAELPNKKADPNSIEESLRNAAKAKAAAAKKAATKKSVATKKATPKKPPLTFGPKYGINISSDTTINSIQAGSQAAQIGLKAGDVVLQIDKQPVKSPEDIERIMLSRPLGISYWLISRDDFQFFVRVKK